MSKNVEATWERIRPYDEWRARLTNLPADTWASIEYVEHSAAQDGLYPYFNMHCAVVPQVLGADQVFEQHYSNAVITQAEEYSTLTEWLSRLGIPVFSVVADYPLRKFAVKNIMDADSEIETMDRAKFVIDVIHQRFKDGRDSNEPIRERKDVTRYSSWHRQVLSSNSYLHDVDYVELRNQRPVAVIERTQDAQGDLERTFFYFMTRGFTQGMILLQVAEKLGVRCFCTVYRQDMTRLLLVELNRHVVELSRPLSGERARLSEEFIATRGMSYKNAQGMACARLYEQNATLLDQMLDATEHREFSTDEYTAWLEPLGPP